ncbi:predicted protein [Histoplasma capsulatum var. duboisii H88]|uniref:Predicted protein n=2 Tax=Ajellomyces capsulatus TaxID=5037 RepID=F0UAB9_AJEC8|nr:predicted protein [Histoplasma capsulatum H143]EGC43681.1 predicted protein [Histoplasma capsulatum var. duboisii H88]QSS49837.1 hypothetical protein I7I53_10313 [Histoplasma capsulatum var. duboisii H88]
MHNCIDELLDSLSLKARDGLVLSEVWSLTCHYRQRSFVTSLLQLSIMGVARLEILRKLPTTPPAKETQGAATGILSIPEIEERESAAYGTECCGSALMSC